MTNTVISRSAIETLFECERKRYYNYDFDKQGIVSTRSLFDTDLGIAVHDSVYSSQLREGDYNFKALATLSTEDNVLVGGLTETFKTEILPTFQRDYDIVSLEQEWTLPIPATDFTLALRMDAILRHKATGQLEIIDYKTKKALGWIKEAEYKFNLQTALYTWAVEEQTQEEIRGITYIIFEKGEVKLDKSKTFENRIRHSPYCYGYKSDHGAHQVKWAKGWKKFQTWKEFDTNTWVNKIMDAEDRKSTFMVIPELKLDPKVRQLMIDNAMRKEDFYQTIVNSGNESVLYRNHKACNKFGVEHQCPYYGLCWYGSQTSKEEFTERVDHHGDE